jgi:hypothetical protein
MDYSNTREGRRTSKEHLPPTTTLLTDDDHPQVAGWPSTPKSVKTSAMAKVSDMAVDLVLVFSSSLFLVFGLSVRHHDRVPTETNPRLTSTLVAGTKYVGFAANCSVNVR